MAKEKTLDELVNGRIVDKVYVPKGLQAIYDLGKILEAPPSPFMTPEDADGRDDRIDRLRKQIKESCDCLTLRSLKSAEVSAISQTAKERLEKLLAENPGTDPREVTIPFKDRQNTLMFVASVVSLATSDGKEVSGKPDTFWIDYLEGIMNDQMSTYMRIVDKFIALMLDKAVEQKVVESIDFLF